jgi:hypothetical protein
VLKMSAKPGSATYVATTSAEKSQQSSWDGFREQRGRKMSNTADDELLTSCNKKANPQTSAQPTKKQAPIPIKNYYVPLRTVEMDAEKEAGNSPASEQQQTTGRPPPMVLTSATNLINLQNKLKGLVKGTLSSEAQAKPTRVITREMADYSAIWTHFDSNKFSYYTFYTKSEKTIKAVIRPLPIDMPAEDMSNGLLDLRFEVIINLMTSLS